MITFDDWFNGKDDPEQTANYVFGHKDYPYIHGEQGKKNTEDMFKYFY